MNRCLTREKPPLSYLSSKKGELYYLTGGAGQAASGI